MWQGEEMVKNIEKNGDTVCIGIFLFYFERRCLVLYVFFFFQAEDGIRDGTVTGVQTCALPISGRGRGDVPGPPRLGSRAAAHRQDRLRRLRAELPDPLPDPGGDAVDDRPRGPAPAHH